MFEYTLVRSIASIYPFSYLSCFLFFSSKAEKTFADTLANTEIPSNSLARDLHPQYGLIWCKED